MSDTTNGGLAAPPYNWNPYCASGMTLRDYFAAAALASMTVAPDYSKGPCNSSMARRAYDIADAMLAERSKP